MSMAETDTPVTPLTDAQRHALDITRELIKRGAPVFIAKPVTVDGHWDPSANGRGQAGGYHLPGGWQRTKPDPGVVDQWQPGDAL